MLATKTLTYAIMYEKGRNPMKGAQRGRATPSPLFFFKVTSSRCQIPGLKGQCPVCSQLTWPL